LVDTERQRGGRRSSNNSSFTAQVYTKRGWPALSDHATAVAGRKLPVLKFWLALNTACRRWAVVLRLIEIKSRLFCDSGLCETQQIGAERSCETITASFTILISIERLWSY